MTLGINSVLYGFCNHRDQHAFKIRQFFFPFFIGLSLKVEISNAVLYFNFHTLQSDVLAHLPFTHEALDKVLWTLPITACS